jgi:anti-anti-sigma factor
MTSGNRAEAWQRSSRRTTLLERQMDNAEVTIDVASSVPVITVAGEIDVATVALLSRRIEEIPVGSPAVIVDLSELTFIDSSGLSALVACHNRVQTDEQPGVVQLVVSRPSIINLLTITGLLEIFEVVATIEEAKAR